MRLRPPDSNSVQPCSDLPRAARDSLEGSGWIYHQLSPAAHRLLLLVPWDSPAPGQPHTSSPTLGAGTAGLRAVFLEEEPLELAGDVWAATDLLFAPFAPLAALAEWEKVNLNPPAEVLFGRFSLSSLSLAEGQTLPHLGISCTPRSTIHITVQSWGKSQQVFFCSNSAAILSSPTKPILSPPAANWAGPGCWGHQAHLEHTGTFKALLLNGI